MRSADAQGPVSVDLEDGSGIIDIWSSPNTAHVRASRPKPDEPTPPDLQALFDLIGKAQQSILFLVFEPGYPSIVDVIAQAQKANPALFVRGAVTDPEAAGEFATEIHDGQVPLALRKKGDPPPPEDYRVIHTSGITPDDAFGQWTHELNQAGHAVIHDKIVVIDPLSDNCIVAMGSHNDGYKASYNNDEKFNLIKGHRAVAEAYAAHCLDVDDHYAWRYWLATDKDKAWHFVAQDDSWQDAYFAAANTVKLSELNFWPAAVPKSDALPTMHETGSTRMRPALQKQTGGLSPAVGPHAANEKSEKTPKSANLPKPGKPIKRMKTTSQRKPKSKWGHRK